MCLFNSKNKWDCFTMHYSITIFVMEMQHIFLEAEMEFLSTTYIRFIFQKAIRQVDIQMMENVLCSNKWRISVLYTELSTYLFHIAGSILLWHRFRRYSTPPSCRLLYCWWERWQIFRVLWWYCLLLSIMGLLLQEQCMWSPLQKQMDVMFCRDFTK
jgi:hypothetical protein